MACLAVLSRVENCLVMTKVCLTLKMLEKAHVTGVRNFFFLRSYMYI